MDFEVFNKIADGCKLKKPILFGLGNDRIMSPEGIEGFEHRLQVKLPEKYKQFLLKYGGGYFGYANVYSLDEDSGFYVLNHNDMPVYNHLRIADNGCGDYYLVCIADRKCLEQLYFYDHETRDVHNTEYADILEYLVKVGLKMDIHK